MIPDPGSEFFCILDPGAKKALDPGSATLLKTIEKRLRIATCSKGYTAIAFGPQNARKG
jgi:hypothetical protein